MKKVYQSEFGEHGNCFSACVASLLELDISQVPNFCENPKMWFEDCGKFVRQYGYTLLAMAAQTPHHLLKDKDLHYIVTGKGSSSDLYHAVVFRGDKLVHDPNPNNKGFSGIRDFIFLLSTGGVNVSS